MRLKISKFPLSHFQELIPLLLRCFPDFWQPRLALGFYSFPYDLKLFTGRLDDRLVACVGIHDYQVIISKTPLAPRKKYVFSVSGRSPAGGLFKRMG